MTPTEHTIVSLTPETLTAMLRAGGRCGDVEVAGIDVTPVGTGQMATSYRIRLNYSQESPQEPRSLVAKLPSVDESSRAMAQATAAYLREVRFYQLFAATAATRTPTCFYADLADDGVGFTLLLEDLGPATMVDQLRGCTPDQAELAVLQAAGLHGPTWRHPSLATETWLPTLDVWTALTSSMADITPLFLARVGDRLEPDQVRVIEALGAHIPAWLDTLSDHRSLWHGDYRIDNMLFDAQGGEVPLGVVDWQSCSTAPGVIDVSYFIGTSLDTGVGAKIEDDLISTYHEALLSHGVSDYTLQDCRREYRAHAIYGLVLTVPVSMGVQQTERGDAMFAAMARRVADQIIRNDSYAALEA